MPPRNRPPLLALINQCTVLSQNTKEVDSPCQTSIRPFLTSTNRPVKKLVNAERLVILTDINSLTSFVFCSLTISMDTLKQDCSLSKFILKYNIYLIISKGSLSMKDYRTTKTILSSIIRSATQFLITSSEWIHIHIFKCDIYK